MNPDMLRIQHFFQTVKTKINDLTFLNKGV